MRKVTKTNTMKKCSDLDTFSFEPWREHKPTMTKVKAEDGESRVRKIKN
jgi:hypothetical protein